MYSVLSTLSCCSIAWGLIRHRNSGSRWITEKVVQSGGMQTVAFAVQSLGLVIFSQTIPPVCLPFEYKAGDGRHSGNSSSWYLRCPMDYQAAASSGGSSVKNIERVSRHPQLWGFALTGAGAALGTSTATVAVALGAFPVLWTLVGGAHIDNRHRRGSGGILDKERELKTSHIPFMAMLNGRQSFSDFYNGFIVKNGACALALGGLLAGRRFIKHRKMAIR